MKPLNFKVLNGVGVSNVISSIVCFEFPVNVFAVSSHDGTIRIFNSTTFGFIAKLTPHPKKKKLFDLKKVGSTEYCVGGGNFSNSFIKFGSVDHFPYSLFGEVSFRLKEVRAVCCLSKDTSSNLVGVLFHPETLSVVKWSTGKASKIVRDIHISGCTVGVAGRRLKPKSNTWKRRLVRSKLPNDFVYCNSGESGDSVRRVDFSKSKFGSVGQKINIYHKTVHCLDTFITNDEKEMVVIGCDQFSFFMLNFETERVLSVFRIWKGSPISSNVSISSLRTILRHYIVFAGSFGVGVFKIRSGPKNVKLKLVGCASSRKIHKKMYAKKSCHCLSWMWTGSMNSSSIRVLNEGVDRVHIIEIEGEGIELPIKSNEMWEMDKKERIEFLMFQREEYEGERCSIRIKLKNKTLCCSFKGFILD